MPPNFTMDTGHSWDPEKKASGIEDMQPIMVASGIFVRHKVKIFENSGHPVFQGVSPLGRGILKKKNNRDTIHFNGAANQLCIYGAVSKWCGSNSGEPSQSRPESARKMSPEIQIKEEDLKSLVDIPRLPHASGNRMLQNLKDFNSMPFMSKMNISVQLRSSTIRSRKETTFLQLFLMMTDG